MKNCFSIKLVALLMLTAISCQEQKVEKKTKTKPVKVTEEVPDHDPYFIETTTTTSKTGPISITRNILQDRKGNLWFATWEGIIKYDGKLFTNFTNIDSLRRFHVFSILEDKTGNLWFGTIGAGIYRYNGTSFVNFTEKDGLAHNSTACFFEDKDGKIWIGTQGGISIYNGKSFTNFTTNEGLTNNDVNAIVADNSGKIWVGTRGEACIYQANFFSNLVTNEGKTFTNVRSIIKDTKGNMWFGGNDGLWEYNGNSFINHAKNFTGYVYEDKKGSIWTSAADPNSGKQWMLSRYDNNKQLNIRTATTILKKEDMFFGILEDNDGAVWLGGLNGVCRYDGNLFNCFKDEKTEN